jgi:replicative DNA helicase
MERALLGALLSDSNAFSRVFGLVDKSSFYKPNHRTIFQCVKELYERRAPVDLITVSEELRRTGKLDEVGGMPFLSDLASECPTSANIEHYAGVVQEKALLRNMITLTSEAVGAASDPTARADVVLQKVQTDLADIASRSRAHSSNGNGSMKGWIQNKQAEIKARVPRRTISWLATGFTEFDWMTDGYRPKDFIVLAARPSVGKTAKMLNNSRNMAHNGKRVAILSLEQERGALNTRLLSAESGVSFQKLRGLNPLTREEQEDCDAAMERLENLPLWIFDPTDFRDMTLDTILAFARNLHKEKQLDFLAIDHARNFTNNDKFSNDKIFGTKVANAIRELSRELKIPVMILVHLGRVFEKGTAPIPTMADLRDTGKWEEAADIVELLFRLNPETYKKPTIKIGDRDFVWKDMAFNKIAKNRDGKTGVIPLVWRGDYQRFENYEEETQAYKEKEVKSYNPTPEPEQPHEDNEDLPF